MKNNLKILICIMCILLVYSCSKLENVIQTDLSNNTTDCKSNARQANPDFDFLNLESPTRDIDEFIKNGGVLPSTKPEIIGRNTEQTTATTNAGGGSGYPNYHCCNNICLTIPEDPYTFYAPFTDTWGNIISYIGHYGTDPRQMYYVYLPASVNVNSPIIVLIHGGAWSGGPDPTKVNGFTRKFADVNSSDNLVKDLLIDSFVVVAPLYRLMQYGDTTAEINANNISWQNQIDDIDAAIKHIHDNFPTCVWQHALNANNIQVLGESAGGHLALMWAYTKASTTYVKSVISMYAPTNMNQFANYLNSKTAHFTCGNTFTSFNPNNIPRPVSHQPYYFYTKSSDPSSTELFASVSTPMLCTANNAGAQYARVYDCYKLVESGIKTVVTNPLSNPLFTNFAPRNALNAGRIIPTFIMHGTDDWLVPYKYATDSMKVKLANTGGLIDSLNSSSANNVVPTTYTSNKKHLLKMYTGANHAWGNFNLTTIRKDVRKWFNGHK